MVYEIETNIYGTRLNWITFILGKFFFHYYYSEPVSNVITVEYCGFLKRDLVYESLVDRSNEDSHF